MLMQEKPLMRSLRRNHASFPASPSNKSRPSIPSSSSWVNLKSVLLVVASSTSSSPLSTDRVNLKSPWSRRRRKNALLPKRWKSLFDTDGRLCDGGVKFLKKIRSGGVDPSIRAEVWPFLLGVYDFKSTKEERSAIKARKRKEYLSLRRRCRQILKLGEKNFKLKETSGNESNEDSGDLSQSLDSTCLEEAISASGSLSVEDVSASCEDCNRIITSGHIVTANTLLEQDGDESGMTNISEPEPESSDSDSSDEPEETEPFLELERMGDNDVVEDPGFTLHKSNCFLGSHSEDFVTWQRIIRLDAIRANCEWTNYSPSQASVSLFKARQLAKTVGLKDYDNLEASSIFHAARLVAILEAYALYDSEIGYCQGMSDLLSPIVSVIEDDHEAFWCFVGFMRKARHNFRLDEEGIRRQLNIVAKIIKNKDSHLYRHLEKLEAEDCFFVYRMVVVLFRRELNYEQILCLWEVMWADQAAIRAGIGKSAWGRMRLRAPPTEDLLLYAIAACVLQRRKLIIEKYCSMDEIMRECNSMAGHLDVWKLLDDAHDLVVNLHDKI